MPQQGFDINAARQAGYSDDEILSHLVQTRNFDVNGAVQSGYSKSDIINYLSASRRDFSLNPPPVASPVPQELQPGMVLTHRGPMKFSDAIKSQDPMVREDARGWGRSASDELKDSSQAALMGVATAAPIMTAGASLPLQAAIGGTSGASLAKLSGGSNKQAAVAGGVGAALPFLGPLASRSVSRFSPSVLRSSAGAAFNTASEAAGANQVNAEGAGQAALGAQELQQVGRTMPRVMTRFLQRVTAPNASELTYDEARKFYSAAGELSANESSAITPAMRRLLNQFKGQLGEAIQDTAERAGVGTEYGQAMDQYARAKRMEDTWDVVWSATKKNLIPGLMKGLGAGAGGAAAYGMYRSLTK